MRRGTQSHTVTANVGVVGGGGVQDVRAVDFLGLLERLDQAEVRRMELGLVEVVVHRLAGDGVTKGNFRMLLVVDKPFTSAVVEGGLATFSLQLREAEEPHFGGAFESQFRVVLRENPVVLRRDHLVFAFNATQARQEKVFNR